MYPDYFGLKEPSFSITPDPQYLYLSEQHREALAHLLYGAGAGGGFVLLTGEVGTGKTTICRAFLEQLPGHVEVALILNPALTARELLQAICREFHVPLPPGEPSSPVLIDALNAYLLAAHAQGRRPVLLIDEAQNLQPAVLEQVRLLTNLETAKHKLLQVFLVGQPELRGLLDQEGLRQVAQRITARFHLTPLNGAESADYIRHRLAVAGVTRRLFTAPAIRYIHRISGGIPRLINILCDRALLGAYATQSRGVDRGIVRRAAQELYGGPRRSWKGQGRIAWVGLLALIAIALGGRLYPWTPPVWFPIPVTTENPRRLPDPAQAPTATAKGPRSVPSPPTPVDPPALPSAPSVLPTAFLLPRSMAMNLLLRRWAVEPIPGRAREDPCEQAAAAGLHCRGGGDGSWQQLRQYDRPAVLRLHDAEGSSAYVLVNGLDPGQVLLDSGAHQEWLPLGAVEPLWSGAFVILWRPPPGGYHLIGSGAPPAIVHWLRQTLARVAGHTLMDLQSETFDESLRTALRAFQTRQGLQPDGIAGPETLIRLNRAAGLPDIPNLQHGNL